MADYSGIFNSLGGVASDIFGASGHKSAAKAYDKAASYARQGAQLEGVSTNIRQMQADREIYKVLGGQRADVAGAGLANAGTALDLFRDSAAQGAMTKSLLGIQGEINVLGQQAQATAYAGQAASERAQAGGGFFGGLLKAVGVGIKVAAL